MGLGLEVAKLERISHEINLGDLDLEHRTKRQFTPREYNRRSSFILPNVFDFKAPSMPPKYFAIDIDKTFFHKDEHIFSKNLQAFIKVRNLGYEPFLCTARPFQTLPYIFGDEFFRKSGYRGYPGIYLNGSVIYDKYGNLISMNCFKRNFVEEVLEYIMMTNQEDAFLFWDINGHYSLKNINDQVNFLLIGDAIPKPTILSPKELAEKEIICIISSAPKIDFKIASFGKDYMVRSVGIGYLIEYNPKGTTKADGIITLMKHVNLKPESCGFIGDGDNDVEGMELCDLSFAVANATNYVKRHAKWILHLNYYDGAFSYVMNLVYNIYHF